MMTILSFLLFPIAIMWRSRWFVREPHRLVNASQAVDLTSIATTNLVNATTERGELKSVQFHMTTALTGSPVITLRITIDGGTNYDILLYNSGIIMHADAGGHIEQPGGTASSSSAINMTWKIHLNVPYHSSCLVAVIVGTGGSAGAANFSVVRSVPVGS